MPLAGRRPAARRIAAALLERGGDALAAGARVVKGRGTAPTAPPGDASRGAAAEEDPAARRAGADDAAGRRAAAEEVAARLDAARARLRATVAPPGDDAADGVDPSAPR